MTRIDEYFEFLAPDDIRIKGTRIGIETVLYEYIYREQSPEMIVRRFPSLKLDQVYATILYYLQHQETITAYMSDWLRYGQRMREKQAQKPPPVVLRLRQLKLQRQQEQERERA